MHYKTVTEVAEDLGLSDRTVQRYCRTGFLPAKQIWVENHHIYHVDLIEYYEWKEKHFRGLKKAQIRKSNRLNRGLSKSKIKEEMAEWLDWCRTGKLTGKPLAVRTVEIYDYYFNLFLNKLKTQSKRAVISVENVREVMGEIPVTSFSTRRNIYDSVMSFTKYLIEQSKLEEEVRTKLKNLKPKRFMPAKQSSLSEAELEELMRAVAAIDCADYAKLLSKALIVFLVNTGLRNTECCKLKLEDVDLQSKRVYVKLGKGNKNRVVGLSPETYEVLIEYLKARLEKFGQASEYFFIHKHGEPYNTKSLSKKISMLALRAGLKNISPHSLRRSFVTINVNRGKPLVHLQVACGHSDITITRGYCQTTEDEVVKAMQSW